MISTARRIWKPTTVAALAACAVGAQAQFWSVCFDPMNLMPISPDYNRIDAGNAIMIAGIGLTGNVSWGPMSPCGEPPGNTPQDAEGYLMLRNGGIGSLLSVDDDNCAITMGAPFAGNEWSYASIRVVSGETTTDERWGEGGLSDARSGASFRYITAEDTIAGVRADLTIRSLANASRYEWTLTNTTADTVQVGLRHMSWMGMINLAAGFSGFGGNNYVLSPAGRPIIIERDFVRATNPIGFPKSVDFTFRQSNPYPKLRVYTEFDASHPDETRADRLAIGGWDVLNGGLWDVTIRPDFLIGNTTWAKWYNPTTVGPGQTRRIVYYLENPMMANSFASLTSTGGVAKAVEAPQIVAFDNMSGTLSPNPFRVACWVDNQFSWVSGDISLTNVACTIMLPPGLTLDAGEIPTKIIPLIAPDVLELVTWNVVADGTHPGPNRIQVKVTPNPGSTETLEGVVIIAAEPKADIALGPNLITLPWVLADTNMETTLGLADPADFDAWNWDVLTQAYVQAIDFVRGRGHWIVANANFPATAFLGATDAGDSVTGNVTFVVQRGWNLIGNPYPYPVQLNQMNGISASSPNEVVPWADLNSRGWIRGTLFSYDPLIADYKFSSDASQLIMPHLGYWVYVNTTANITLYWPPIFLSGLPGSPRAAEWSTMTENQWRLQLSARGVNGSDVSNYLGVAPSSREADRLSAPEPPSAPGSKVRLAFHRENGTPTHWAQDIRENRSRQTYSLQFNAAEAGTYSLSWPNVSQLPRNVRVRVTDRTNGQTRDMRMSSAYSFTMSDAGSRLFDIVVEPGGAARAVIGSVNIAAGSRDPQSPVSIQYSLSVGATVTTRILGPSGKEVHSMTRGRAEAAGVNTVTWNKRDSAGRAVAPGNYIVEIVAETADGQRVRVTRPVIVTR